MFKKIQLTIKATKLYQKKIQAANCVEQLSIKFQMDELKNKIADLVFKGKLSLTEASAIYSILECGEVK